MILDHETPEEKMESATLRLEQQLDKVYHAIPQWVNQMYHDCSLAERVKKGFEHQLKSWTDSYVREVQDHTKMREFCLFLCKKQGLDLTQEYWNFLISKDLEKASPEEKEVLTKMKKGV